MLFFSFQNYLNFSRIIFTIYIPIFMVFHFIFPLPFLICLYFTLTFFSFARVSLSFTCFSSHIFWPHEPPSPLSLSRYFINSSHRFLMRGLLTFFFLIIHQGLSLLSFFCWYIGWHRPSSPSPFQL